MVSTMDDPGSIILKVVLLFALILVNAFFAMSEMGVKPDECVFIGDSGMDVRTGVNCGALPVGVLWGFRLADELLENGAKYLINKPNELLDIIEKING